jgi:hypothetical protein
LCSSLTVRDQVYSEGILRLIRYEK